MRPGILKRFLILIQDVDLNHLELTPQQIEEENLRRADQRRRQKEIESRLASLRDKGRGDYL